MGPVQLRTEVNKLIVEGVIRRGQNVKPGTHRRKLVLKAGDAVDKSAKRDLRNNVGGNDSGPGCEDCQLIGRKARTRAASFIRPNVIHYGCIFIKMVVRRLAHSRVELLIESYQKVNKGQGDVFGRDTSSLAGGFPVGVSRRYRIAWVYFGVESNQVKANNKEFFENE